MSDAVEISERLIQYLKESTKILVFTGAGVSTGSGIPDFRGPGGVWERRQPVYYQDFMTSESARVEHWDYKLEGWAAFRDACPNAIHSSIVQLEQAGKLRMLVTQNIDGLHTKAGTSPERLIELHGTNRLVECQSCHRTTEPEPHFEFFRTQRKTPRCECGGYLKPATISFGQNLRQGDLSNAEMAAHEADLAIALGSSLSVYPAAGIPMAAARKGVPYVVINRGPTDHDSSSEVALRIEGDVTDIFPSAVSIALTNA